MNENKKSSSVWFELYVNSGFADEYCYLLHKEAKWREQLEEQFKPFIKKKPTNYKDWSQIYG